MSEKDGEVTDDQRLLDSINAGEKPVKEEKLLINKKKEEPKVVPEKQEPKPKETPKEEPKGALDPTEDFVKMLESVGIKRPKAELVTDIFFKGDINDPAYLDKSLVLADLGMKQRELVITAYYGASPEELGMELLPQTKAKQLAMMDKVGSGASVGNESPPMELQKVQAEMLRNKFQLLQNRQLMNEFRRMEEEDAKSRAPVAVPKKVVTKPLIDAKGEIVMKDGVPVMERIVYEGDGFTGGGNSSDSIMPILLANLLKDKDKPVAPVVDPNVKPSWAVDMERKIDQQKSDEDKRRLEDELKHEKEKKEEVEKEYKKELERVEQQHQKDIERLREDMKTQLEVQNQRFEDDKRHRAELDEIQGAYGTQLSEIKKELDSTRKDIKSTVVGEAVKSTSTIIKSATQTTEEALKPIAETASEMMKVQIKAMQKAAGIDITKQVPGTTEEELAALARG